MKCVPAVLSEVDYILFGYKSGIRYHRNFAYTCVLCTHGPRPYMFCQNQPAFFHGVLVTHLNMAKAFFALNVVYASKKFQ